MWNRIPIVIGSLARIAAPSFLLSISTAVFAAQPTVEITSPANGAVVYAGHTLLVVVKATPLAFQSVDVGLHAPIGNLWMLTAPPYEFQIPIPANTTSGPCIIAARGVIGPNHTVWAEFIEVDIERPDSPQSLRNEFSIISSYRVGVTIPLQVTGTFADGSHVDVTRSSRLKWISSDPSVASIDKNGMVTVTGPGTAKITITYDDATVVVPVTVPKPKDPEDR